VSGATPFKYQWLDAVTAAGAPTTPNARLAAFVLADYMDIDGGRCFPSLGTIAGRMGRARSTAKNGLRELEGGGWLEVKRGCGRGNRTTYQARLPRDEKGCMNDPISASAEGGTTETKGPMSDAKGVNGRPRTTQGISQKQPRSSAAAHAGPETPSQRRPGPLVMDACMRCGRHGPCIDDGKAVVCNGGCEDGQVA
jgi:hypothetical protein